MINYYPLVRQPRPRRINNRNSRASESKASSSLECSAERSRKSTQLKLVCEYRTAGLPVKSSPSEKGKVLIKREQCQMHLNIAEREGLRRSQRGFRGKRWSPSLGQEGTGEFSKSRSLSLQERTGEVENQSH